MYMSNGITEEIDTAEDLIAANYLKSEYKMAYQNAGIVWIEDENGKTV